MPHVFSPGAAAFLDLSTALPTEMARGRLHPGRILDATNDGCVVECEASAPLAQGMPLRLLYSDGDAFHQQVMRVSALHSQSGNLRVTLGPAGAPAPAERRKSPRLTCDGANLLAELERARGPLLDLGSHGFALRAQQGLTIGDVVRVAVRHASENFPCTVVVKNVRQLPTGLLQYGVFCENPHDGTAPWRLADLYGALRHGLLEPLRSAYESDPDMADLVREFAVEILQFASETERLVAASDWSQLRVLSHTLKGAGGGYGFQPITEVSAELEAALAQTKPQEVVEHLADKLCATLRSVRVTAQA
jgi:HPt (histidine-containing phosphotransfer) domain-containing protein